MSDNSEGSPTDMTSIENITYGDFVKEIVVLADDEKLKTAQKLRNMLAKDRNLDQAAFQYDKQLMKIKKLISRIIKKKGDEVIDKIKESYDLIREFKEVNIDKINVEILKYVLNKKIYIDVPVSSRQDCLIIKTDQEDESDG